MITIKFSFKDIDHVTRIYNDLLECIPKENCSISAPSYNPQKKRYIIQMHFGTNEMLTSKHYSIQLPWYAIESCVLTFPKRTRKKRK